ncbi:unnamed protein product [Lactuca saligna]|uniref:Uncharacterized protein n=1 Tax=Lactuca saligna TaxID=75948 RepID=A0AA35YV78_LACSI|nr:unnamed protein product [Lactuca saligna]
MNHIKSTTVTTTDISCHCLNIIRHHRTTISRCPRVTLGFTTTTIAQHHSPPPSLLSRILFVFIIDYEFLWGDFKGKNQERFLNLITVAFPVANIKENNKRNLNRVCFNNMTVIAPIIHFRYGRKIICIQVDITCLKGKKMFLRIVLLIGF